MDKIDISLLKDPPKITEKVILEIEPLAPLSMVSDLPSTEIIQKYFDTTI